MIYVLAPCGHSLPALGAISFKVSPDNRTGSGVWGSKPLIERPKGAKLLDIAKAGDIVRALGLRLPGAWLPSPY